MQNCQKKLHSSVRALKRKKIKGPLTVLFTSDVMYKKYKRLVYTPPDFLAKFCKVILSNTKNSASFFIFVFLLDKGMQPIVGCNRGLWCVITGLYKIKFRGCPVKERSRRWATESLCLGRIYFPGLTTVIKSHYGSRL